MNEFLQGISIIGFYLVSWEAVLLSPIICFIAWGHLLFKVRETSPYIFYSLLIGLLVFAFMLFNPFIDRNNDFSFFPIAGLLIALIHLNYLALSRLSNRWRVLPAIGNSFALLVCAVLWAHLPDVNLYSVSPELFLLSSSFSFLMAYFWLMFHPFRRFFFSEKAKAKPAKLSENLILVAILSSVCIFVTYLSYVFVLPMPAS